MPTVFLDKVEKSRYSRRARVGNTKWALRGAKILDNFRVLPLKNFGQFSRFTRFLVKKILISKENGRFAAKTIVEIARFFRSEIFGKITPAILGFCWYVEHRTHCSIGRPFSKNVRFRKVRFIGANRNFR